MPNSANVDEENPSMPESVKTEWNFASASRTNSSYPGLSLTLISINRLHSAPTSVKSRSTTEKPFLATNFSVRDFNQLPLRALSAWSTYSFRL